MVVLENKVLVRSADEDDRDLPHTSPGSAHYPQPNLVSQYEGILHDALLPHILLLLALLLLNVYSTCSGLAGTVLH